MPSSVHLVGDSSSPRDSDAKCDDCGRPGTVARAQRDTTPPATHRYCNDCWPAAKKRLVAEDERLRNEMRVEWRRTNKPFEPTPLPQPSGWSWSSRSWTDTIEFLETIAAGQSDMPFPGAALSQVAAEIAKVAPEMEGPMPPVVREFLQAHFSLNDPGDR
jgi:hypothetical protein